MLTTFMHLTLMRSSHMMGFHLVVFLTSVVMHYQVLAVVSYGHGVEFHSHLHALTYI